ncbi:hypothetical protein VitviT2T_018209 [Vitis vinifera]|uniref:Pesticidal crystal cry8Ba protein n=1 Tax=Vitis vinifera TaxID=29760 RepID=A0ABY9CWK7_VITVI|nr:uncharacterized protein LOC100254633 [Vitis vinifera]WJZ99793.1 hypothetical protein VitviT2T_018209 [Vitis vinifera]|eukprot:XP_010657508.1 PREDICTED: uncharacterized protein LOC100254633 isoform X1 [Vitis vinifera]
MFTEGLDQTAIDWIKQGSDLEEKHVRSPLTEKLACDAFPKSPLSYNTNGYASPHVLPPLKFRSGFLGPHSTVTLGLDDHTEEEEESVASAPDDTDGNYSEVSEEEELELEKPFAPFYDEEIFHSLSRRNLNPSALNRSDHRNVSSINRGVSKENLRIEVPENCKRFTDGELGTREGVRPNSAPHCYSQTDEQVQLCSAHLQGTPANGNMVKDLGDLGTPSAPPIMDIASEGKVFSVESKEERASRFSLEIEQSGNGACRPKESDVFCRRKEGLSDGRTQFPKNSELGERANKSMHWETESQIPQATLDHSPYYNTSGQNAWQTLIAYDACIRLCLHAWARGCTEAPEFLRDECLVLWKAFGLQKFLLQPRGTQPIEGGAKNVEQTCSLKAKKVVGKIRVEVRKLRIIPRRKLKSTYSQRGAFYVQAGAEYVRHVSSLMKTGINSLLLTSSSVTSEGSEQFSCFFHLKSSAEDAEMEPGSAICLHPGTGDYHVFFPESQGDALLLEVQDAKKSVQGRCTIPISSLSDNPSERIRWWSIFHDDHECVGKVQLSIGSTITFDETNHIKSGAVVETLAYDLLLEAAMRAQHFHSRNLWLHGPWKWLLTEFADYYGVSDSYTKLRYLSYVMNVATPTKDCLELVHELLVPVIKARSEKSLTRQEKSILLDCETQVESLLANVFENYKSLDENSPAGLAELFDPTPESAAPALAPAVQIFILLHDILAQEAQTMLRNYFQTAAKKRCRKHMLDTDEFLSSNSDGFLMDPITISTAYSKMKNLCVNIGNEIQADIKIHNQHILPSSIDLSNITAAVYSTDLSNRLTGFLAAWPPSSPLPHVNELLIATADFERNLESWNIRPVQGGVDSKNLFHNYIMVWIQDMQLNLLELCKAEKVPWSGVTTNHSTSPFAEEMYEKIKDTLVEYEVVINRWPHYSLVWENAVANVERAIIKALEKQYNDILTPLKDSIPKRLNMHVQKLTRRQSTALYSVPNQLGTFLNTIKRILDVLHCRIEDILKSWASYLPVIGDRKSLFGEQMNAITVLLRTKYKNYIQATVGKLVNNMQANRSTRLKRILEETNEADGEAEVRERMQMLSSQLIDSISNLHEVFTSRIFVAICRGFWDRMGQIVLNFLEGRKENRVWYNGSYYALGILDDTFASQMQRLQGNALQEKDIEPPRSVIEARSILCRDTTNATDPSNYFYV